MISKKPCPLKAFALSFALSYTKDAAGWHCRLTRSMAYTKRNRKSGVVLTLQAGRAPGIDVKLTFACPMVPVPGQEGVGGGVPDVLIDAISHAIEFAQVGSNGRVATDLHPAHAV